MEPFTMSTFEDMQPSPSLPSLEDETLPHAPPNSIASLSIDQPINTSPYAEANAPPPSPGACETAGSPSPTPLVRDDSQNTDQHCLPAKPTYFQAEGPLPFLPPSRANVSKRPPLSPQPSHFENSNPPPHVLLKALPIAFFLVPLLSLLILSILNPTSGLISSIPHVILFGLLLACVLYFTLTTLTPLLQPVIRPIYVLRAIPSPPEEITTSVQEAVNPNSDPDIVSDDDKPVAQRNKSFWSKTITMADPSTEKTYPAPSVDCDETEPAAQRNKPFWSKIAAVDALRTTVGSVPGVVSDESEPVAQYSYSFWSKATAVGSLDKTTDLGPHLVSDEIEPVAQRWSRIKTSTPQKKIVDLATHVVSDESEAVSPRRKSFWPKSIRLRWPKSARMRRLRGTHPRSHSDYISDSSDCHKNIYATGMGPNNAGAVGMRGWLKRLWGQFREMLSWTRTRKSQLTH